MTKDVKSGLSTLMYKYGNNSEGPTCNYVTFILGGHSHVYVYIHTYMYLLGQCQCVLLLLFLSVVAILSRGPL